MTDWQYDPAHDLGIPAEKRIKCIEREPGWMSLILHRIATVLARLYAILYHRIEITGRENIPAKAPFIMIANHASHLDTIALLSALPVAISDKTYPISAGDHFFNTNARAAFASTIINALPLWRHRCSARSLSSFREKIVKEGCVYILFPEGTRTRDGEMHQFKSGIGHVVAGVPVPVVPCYIQGAEQAYPPGAHFPRPIKLRLTIGAPLGFESMPDNKHSWREIGAQLEEAVTQLGASVRTRPVPENRTTPVPLH